ncbi:hypothetical protein L873DRAFT_1785313 [Choiromyces venosus 120613-1]|uniref:Uncharacterized protein n=1 Tax=Choiromyces venosus 120613-1 TaxID=1336337 RepID=A0A3N4K761_9PEZI|nr:hypothetical protein L873DRAFT_1785313 [Choiromyces venosus 120613-1]
MYPEITNEPRLNQHNWAAEVQFADWALQIPIEAFAFTNEFWIDIGGTLYIWEKETKKERVQNARELKAENEAKLQQISEKRKWAIQPGTEEHLFLEEKNKQIMKYNIQRKAREPQKKCQNPNWEFGEEMVE